MMTMIELKESLRQAKKLLDEAESVELEEAVYFVHAILENILKEIERDEQCSAKIYMGR